jgi:hypothetical protein
MGGRTNKWIWKVINDIKEVTGAHIMRRDPVGSEEHIRPAEHLLEECQFDDFLFFFCF